MAGQMELKYSGIADLMATSLISNRPKAREYDPIPSVWDGDDAELLERMLALYPRKPPRRILDATVNGGRFWRGSNRRVIGIDIEARQDY